jgi:hypothetical protein
LILFGSLLQVNKQKEMVKKKEATLGKKSFKGKQKKGEKVKKKKVGAFLGVCMQ